MEKLAEMGFTERDINEVLTVQIETTGSPFSTYAELVSALLQRQQARAAGCESFPQSTPQGDERLPASPPLLTIPQGIAFPRLNEDFRERNCLSAVTSPTSPAPDKSSLRRTLSAPASRSSESDESLEERLERMQEERRCKICMDAELGVVFLPCGHLSCCAVCADGVEVCPMCRTPIREKIRTYLS
ncbi:Iap2p [Desmophyllum pertusum]|uniref:Iap2p n=1 Tax=Desmophyllum pertusum TaxID=174260 RepID=A0A9X0DD25_9CNID|nr:Iap2p [Desmophyllum pertusum]